MEPYQHTTGGSQDPGPLPAYLNIPQVDLPAEPRVWLHRGDFGAVGVVNLGAGLTAHISTPAQARGLARAFTRAAEMLALDAAEAAADDEALS